MLGRIFYKVTYVFLYPGDSQFYKHNTVNIMIIKATDPNYVYSF